MNATARDYKSLSLVGLAIIFLSALHCSAQQEEHHQQNIPKIVMNEVPLSAAIKNLARQADFNYILDPHVPSDSVATPVTFTLTNITANETLDKILKLRGLVKIENPSTSVTRIAPEKLHIKPVSVDLLKNDTNVVIPIIVFDEVPLPDAIKALANQLRLKVSFDEKLMASPAGQSVFSNQVSTRWSKLTARQAMVALLDNYGLVMNEDSSGSTATITLMKETSPSNSP
jgi:hypothetical protein